MKPIQHELAERMRAWAWRNQNDPFSADVLAAAVYVERAPPPPASDGMKERNALIRQYFKSYCWDAASERAGITRFLMDVRTYRNGEFRHHQHKTICPDTMNPSRAMLWRILTSGPPLPDSIEGIRKILQ